MDKPQEQSRNVVGDTVIALIAGVVTIAAGLALVFLLVRDVVGQLKQLSDGLLALMCLVTGGGIVGAAAVVAGLSSWSNGRSNARLHEQNAQLHTAVVNMAQEQQHGMKVLAAYLMGKDDRLQLPAPDDLDDDAEATRPRFEHIGNGHYISLDSTIDDANRLRKLHERGIPVSRQTAAGEGITDPGRYQRAVDKLAKWGYVLPMRQGKPLVWNAQTGEADDTSPTD